MIFINVLRVWFDQIRFPMASQQQQRLLLWFKCCYVISVCNSSRIGCGGHIGVCSTLCSYLPCWVTFLWLGATKKSPRLYKHEPTRSLGGWMLVTSLWNRPDSRTHFKWALIHFLTNNHRTEEGWKPPGLHKPQCRRIFNVKSTGG